MKEVRSLKKKNDFVLEMLVFYRIALKVVFFHLFRKFIWEGHTILVGHFYIKLNFQLKTTFKHFFWIINMFTQLPFKF
jgi:hypothetical protein